MENFKLLNVAPFKSQPVVLGQIDEPDFLSSPLERPIGQTCNCIPSTEVRRSSDSFRFVDVLHIPITSVVPCIRPLDRKAIFFADLRYTFSRPMSQRYAYISRKMLLESDRVKRGIRRATAHDQALNPSDASKADNQVEKRATHKAINYFDEMRAKLNIVVSSFVTFFGLSNLLDTMYLSHGFRGIDTIASFCTFTLGFVIMGFVGWCIFKIFRHVLGGMLVSPAQMTQVQEAEKLGYPVIYMPLHKSHLDYVLLTFIVWHWDLRLPYVASGDNLNLSGLGWLLRCLGGFFIRRRLDGDANSKDYIYRSILHSYMDSLLCQHQSIEFFPEGTRTRNGKPLIPKSGLLSVVVDSYFEGKIPDAVLIPVAATYEHLIEGGFVDELMGLPKRRESMIGVIRNVWNSFGKYIGYARAEFGHPVLLSDIITLLKPSIESETFSNATTGLMSAHPSSTWLSSYNDTSSEMSPSSNEVKNVDKRSLVKAISYHLVSDAEDHAPLTVSQMLAALLLAKYRHGACLADLCVDFDWLASETLTKSRDVIGYWPTKTDPLLAVSRAFKLLGHELVNVDVWYGDSDSGIETECQTPSLTEKFDLSFADTKSTFLKPNIDHREALLLSYYKNGFLSAFRLDSVVCCTLLSYRNNLIGGPVLQNELISRAHFLCELLKFEFIFYKPCQSLDSLLVTVLNHFLSGRLVLLEKQRNGNTTSDRRHFDEDWIDDVVNDFQDEKTPEVEFGSVPKIDHDLELIGISPHCNWWSISIVKFYANLLMPIIESYHIVLLKVIQLFRDDISSIPEKQLMSNFFDKSDFSREYSVEALNADTFKNALTLLVDWSVVQVKCSEENPRQIQICLNEEFSEQDLIDLAKKTELFLI